jgi:hypothetical protein
MTSRVGNEGGPRGCSGQLSLEQGADKEVAVARALEALPDGWIVLHDLRWPGRQRVNLDHVVVGSAGVFAVDAKNWSGRIEVRNGVLSQNGRRREDAVSSVTAATIVVQQLVSPHPCVGVLCFVRDEPLANSSWNVAVCSTANLVTTLASRTVVLGTGDVRRCAEAIRVGTATRAARPAVPQRSGRARRTSTKRARPFAALAGGLVLSLPFEWRLPAGCRLGEQAFR